MNEPLVVEYVELHARLATVAADTEEFFHTRLDQIWYAEMTEDDRFEAVRRLSALGSKDRTWHAERRVEEA
jgi:hypothetical protein